MAEVRRIGGRIHLRLNQPERTALLEIVDMLARHVHAARPSREVYESKAFEAEYDQFVRPGVIEGRDVDIDVVRESLRSGEDTCALTESHAYAWMRALNHLRLAAASVLAIEDDGWLEDLDTATRERMEYRALIALAYLQEELVAALQT
jgi:hypothetical protein